METLADRLAASQMFAVTKQQQQQPNTFSTFNFSTDPSTRKAAPSVPDRADVGLRLTLDQLPLTLFASLPVKLAASR